MLSLQDELETFIDEFDTGCATFDEFDEAFSDFVKESLGEKFWRTNEDE